MRRLLCCAATVLLASCATARPVRNLQRCATPRMPLPQAVRDGKLSGLVGVAYTLNERGEAFAVTPLPGFPGAGAPLFDATEAWLTSCAHEPQTAPLQKTAVFALTRPLAGVQQLGVVPVDEHDLVAQGGWAPRAASCEPKFPPVYSTDADYTVQTDGTVTDVSFPPRAPELEPLSPAAQASLERDHDLYRAWFAACRQEPGRDANGQRVAVRVRSGHPASEQKEPSRALHCTTRYPNVTDEVRQSGIRGLVLVSYFVDTTGEVSIPVPINDAHPALYATVRGWFATCHGDPRPARVHLIQPFSFKPGPY